MLAQADVPLWEAAADWAKEAGTVAISVTTANGASFTQEYPDTTRATAITTMLEMLWSGATQVIASPRAVDIIGHRVVHGGPEYRQSTRITPDVIAAIEQYAVLAPAHNHKTLQGITVCQNLFPDIPQVVVFDTAFHAQLPLAAATYPGPYAWFEQGIRRYGFHGLSHHYCAERAAHLLGRDLASLRLITCHLGGGCSLAAIQHGQSVDTTMGFTPLDGLMMNNRSGAVDPGILLYLLQHSGYTAEQLDRELNQASGLLGISGVANDLRQIFSARDAGNARAALAIAMYIHSLRRNIGSMLMALGGMDAMIFTGGVGMYNAEVRDEACTPLGCIGLALDGAANANAKPDCDVAHLDSSVRVFVVRTQEEWVIAHDCWQWQTG